MKSFLKHIEKPDYLLGEEDITILKISADNKLPLRDYLPCARLCAKSFACIISLDPQNDPMRKDYSYLHVTGKEGEAEKLLAGGSSGTGAGQSAKPILSCCAK